MSSNTNYGLSLYGLLIDGLLLNGLLLDGLSLYGLSFYGPDRCLASCQNVWMTVVLADPVGRKSSGKFSHPNFCMACVTAEKFEKNVSWAGQARLGQARLGQVRLG